MSLETLNDTEVLNDTPIGTLRVIDWYGQAAVAIMDKHDNDKPARVVHMLKAHENPLAAIYGKRTLESARVLDAYAAAVEMREGSAARAHEDQRADLRADLRRFLSKHEDGREALVTRFARPVS